MATWTLPAEVAAWIALLAEPLHARLAGRLLPLVSGMLFARGRRTVTSWLRGAGIDTAFPAYYYLLGSLGRKADQIAGVLLRLALPLVTPGERVLLGIDDTPTKRYGPKVQGAGIHHNPTPGPADQQFLYGPSGSRSPCWCAIHCGTASACRCARCCTCGRKMSRRCRPAPALPFVPSWRWPPT